MFEWTWKEEDFLSGWHQALNVMNPFLKGHPSLIVQEAYSRGADIRELMMLHDCFIKRMNPLSLLERELDDIIPWPWDAESYEKRIKEVFAWSEEHYKPQNILIEGMVGRYAALEDN